MLQSLSEPLDVSPIAAGKNGGPARRVVGSYKKVDAQQVQTDSRTHRGQICLGHRLGHRHREQPTSLAVHQMGGPQLPGAIEKPLHPLYRKGADDPTDQRIEGDSAGSLTKSLGSRRGQGPVW